MKTQSKILLLSLSMLTIPSVTFAGCDRQVYQEGQKIEWYVDECGHWRPGYSEHYDRSNSYTSRSFVSSDNPDTYSSWSR